MTAGALSHDPLWPRAGDWPDLDGLPPGVRADLAIIGVPAWRTSLSPTNAHATPAAIREALRRYSPALVPDRSRDPFWDPGLPGARPPGVVDLGELAYADAGDIDEPDGEPGEARTRARVAHALTRSEALVALGGDNSVTVATALGAWGDDLGTAGLVTIDAHYDLRDGVSNGSPVRRLIEAGLDPRRIVQIGIADFANSAAYARRAHDLGITVVHRDELRYYAHPANLMAEALAVAGAAGGPVHLDVDVDACDRSVVPACPASVPGGLSAWELRALVRAAATDPRVRSADLVEIDATADAPDGRTVRLAALCVLEFAAGLAVRRAAAGVPPEPEGGRLGA
ncbi:arginase family protein [Agromyces aurantiacus]|uniref:Arginase family protein n=1 Tax=Agromyces aurantiacus TaxID=165814 RepID=A0ABV9R0X4_9MICO|nr:arginase family protein [Agromyces aurantiacus]MBM7506075.1 arginase family enzyme [Agromyces aurantiacus]